MAELFYGGARKKTEGRVRKENERGEDRDGEVELGRRSWIA